MAKDVFHGPLEKVDECCYRIPKSYKPGMRVDGLIFADERLLQQIMERGYLDASASHESAALELNVSRATYFRRLRIASQRVADYVLASRAAS